MPQVNKCPRNATEAIVAQQRLNCSTDKFGNNQYLCLPNVEKTSLFEFCYDGIMGLRENGTCLRVSEGKNVIIESCFDISNGCPKEHYKIGEFYKYPACQNVSQSSSLQMEENSNSLIRLWFFIYAGLLVITCFAIVAFILWRRKMNNKYQGSLNTKEEEDGKKQSGWQNECNVEENGDVAAEDESCWYLCTTVDKQQPLARYSYLTFLFDTMKHKKNNTKQQWDAKHYSFFIGGEINETQKQELSKWSSMRKLSVVDSISNKIDRKDEEMAYGTVIAYIIKSEGNTHTLNKELGKVNRFVSLTNGIMVYALNSSCLPDGNMKDILRNRATEFGLSNVEFIEDSLESIIEKVTFILEQEMKTFLREYKMELIRQNDKNDQLILSLNSLLRKLEETSQFSETNHEQRNNPGKPIEELLLRFKESILFSGYGDNGKTFYILVNNEQAKEDLERLLPSELSYKIYIQDKLEIKKLCKKTLQGAKCFCGGIDGKTSMDSDKYCTTGSLMKTNDDSMIAITAAHALIPETEVYAMIDDSAVKLGIGFSVPRNDYMHQGIGFIPIDKETSRFIDEKCEKRLIDDTNTPTPAKIMPHYPHFGDIVHKRGATSGFTTGIITNVQDLSHDRRMIFIKGLNGEPFAMPGDSGSIVYTKSFLRNECILEVAGIVFGRVDLPESDFICACLSFFECCDDLYKYRPDMQPLTFF